MAAPVPTARQTPTGIKLDDGLHCFITFARDPDISIWEKETTPPGLDTGDPIDTTTHHNQTWRTKALRKLAELTESSVVCAYDPNCYNQLLALRGVPDTITITFPDGSTLAFYGGLKGIEFAGLSEGEFPEATLTITCTNFDHVNKVEAGPVLTSVAGT